ncbi:putative cyanobacterial aminoacyl-tRNA synthetase, CAAD domain, protein CURVATURE THYLAKOID 1 [Helianthus annuus]|nr:putative cyanobacterial aminoacyl-tRNA synthetase, CAAD domain, protein CURVATURE THYLAKOID 1 [Helianthus annuus]
MYRRTCHPEKHLHYLLSRINIGKCGCEYSYFPSSEHTPSSESFSPVQPPTQQVITMAAAATSIMLPQFPTTSVTVRSTALPNLPIRPFRTSFNRVSGSRRSALFHVKASEDASSSIDTDELFNDLKEKWDAVENKPTVIIYGAGAAVAIWLSSVVIGAINKVPLLPNLMELVGVGYSGWFVYRYLLFESSRKELTTNIESIKKKITEA